MEEDIFAPPPKGIRKYKDMKKNTKFYFLQIKNIADWKVSEEKLYEITFVAKYKTKEKKYVIYTNLRLWKPGSNLAIALIIADSISITGINKLSFAKRKEWFVGYELMKKVLCKGDLRYFLDEVLKISSENRDIYIKKTLL